MPLAAYTEVADMILFDSRPPKTPGSLPGGNGLSFDWRLLQRLSLHRPWLLSGGLHEGNLADAIRLCRADAVDVSSGVEAEPGIKDLAKIRDFLEPRRHASTLSHLTADLNHAPPEPRAKIDNDASQQPTDRPRREGTLRHPWRPLRRRDPHAAHPRARTGL